VGVYDPVEIGLVPNLARPRGNLTGLQNSGDLTGKRLELIKELLPKLKRVAILWNPANPTNLAQKKDAEVAARVLGVELQSLPVQAPEDFQPALSAARGAGLLQADDALFTTHRRRLVELVASSRLLAIYSLREYADAGGLMSYGTNFPDLYRRAATYVEKILKGAKPADLPVEQPTKFELVINLKTAKALGLTIPPPVLARADEVIQ
jgi:putative ABC transport system substrate-binding protein